MASMLLNKRINTEIKKFTNSELIWLITGDDMKKYRIGIKMPNENNIYAGETYFLNVELLSDYPLTPPIVIFDKSTGNGIPEHEHVYSNGHLCLNILYDDWSPALTLYSVSMSIISMMSSATERKRPPDDARYTMTMNRNPQKTRWDFHDDKV